MVAFINSTFVVMLIGKFLILNVLEGVVAEGGVVRFPINAFPLTVVANGGVVTFPANIFPSTIVFPPTIVFPLFVSAPSKILLLNGINETTHTAIINEPRIKISLVFIFVNLYIRMAYFIDLFSVF